MAIAVIARGLGGGEGRVDRGSAQVGLISVPVDRGNSPVGPGNAPVGPGNAPVDRANVPVGRANAPVGQANAPVDRANVLAGRDSAMDDQGSVPAGREFPREPPVKHRPRENSTLRARQHLEKIGVGRASAAPAGIGGVLGVAPELHVPREGLAPQWPHPPLQ
jgi:hypothetical protein